MPNSTAHNLPVYTVSERFLGRVVDIEIDSATQEVASYHVAAAKVLPGLWYKRLIIDRSQVVSLAPNRLTVQDASASPSPAPKPRLVADPT